MTVSNESSDNEMGCLVNGFFLDGAAWCPSKKHLVELKDGILYDEMASVSTIPTEAI